MPEWGEEALVIEAVRKILVPITSRHRGEVVEHLIHAAILALEHAGHVLIAQRLRPAPRPTRHALKHIERLRVGCERMHVEQTGHDLVQRVERRPDRLAIAEAIEELLGKRAQVAVAKLLLTLRELSDDSVTAGLEDGIAQAL